jgi:hypothetical protein
MIRTRDFLLFLSAVFFLSSSIAATMVADTIGLAGSQAGAVRVATEADIPPPVVPMGALLGEPSTIDRAANLAAMRERLAALDLGAAPVSVTEAPALPVGESMDTLPDAVTDLQTCTTYSEVAWADMPGVQFRIAEGARLLYRTLAPASAPVITDTPGTSSAPVSEVPAEVVLAQLPVRELPMPSPTCIPHDVVGVALDGSLIRNDETALYSVFGPDTLVGYALDGFPIYGTSGLPTDDCGGMVVGGTYRYYQSAERKTVLNCYAAVPVGL